MLDLMQEIETKPKIVACLTCGRRIRSAPTGRPPRYCSDRCKEKARRERDKVRHRFARQEVHPATMAESREINPEGVACRICEVEPASVGPAGNPILCVKCART